MARETQRLRSHLIAVGLGLCAVVLASPTDARAQTEVRIALTSMLPVEETTGQRGIAFKVRPEQPYLRCSGEDVRLSVFVALFERGRMVLSKTGDSVVCGRSSGVSADALVPIVQSVTSEVERESRVAANFIPGDQFLPRARFTSEQYQRGAVLRTLSREIGVDLSAGSLYLVTMISTSPEAEARSTPWIVVARGR